MSDKITPPSKYIAVENVGSFACPIFYAKNRIWWFTSPNLVQNLSSNIEEIKINFQKSQSSKLHSFHVRVDDFFDGLCYSSQDYYRVEDEGEQKKVIPLFPEIKRLTNSYSFDKDASTYKIQDKKDVLLWDYGELQNDIIKSVRNGIIAELKVIDDRQKLNGSLIYHLGTPYGVLFSPKESNREELWPSILKPIKNLIKGLKENEYIIIPIFYLIALVSKIEDFFKEQSMDKEDIASKPLFQYAKDNYSKTFFARLNDDIKGIIQQSDVIVTIKHLEKKEAELLKTDLPNWSGATQFFIQQERIKKFASLIKEKNLIIVQGPAGIGKSWFINYWRRYDHEGKSKNFILDSEEILNIIKKSDSRGDKIDYKDLISIWLFQILLKIGNHYPEFADYKSIKRELEEYANDNGLSFLISFMQKVYDITSPSFKNSEDNIQVIIHLDDLQKYLNTKLSIAIFDNITDSILIIIRRRWNNEKIKLILTTRPLVSLSDIAEDYNFRLDPFSKEEVIRLIYSIFKSPNSQEVGTVIHEWTGGSLIYLNIFINEILKGGSDISTSCINNIAKKVVPWQSNKFRIFHEMLTMFEKSGRFNLYEKIYNILADDKVEDKDCNTIELTREGFITNASEILDLKGAFLFKENDMGDLSFTNKMVKEYYSPNQIRIHLNQEN